MKSSSVPLGYPSVALCAIGGSVFPAQAQPLFDEPTVYPTPSPASSVSVGDLDCDSIADVVITQALESVSLFSGLGGGSLSRVGSLYEPGVRLGNLHTADIGGDGIPDVICVSRSVDNYSIRIVHNNGSGRGAFTQTIPVTRPPGDIGLADLNQDGLPELVMVEGYGPVGRPSACHIFRNRNGVFELNQVVLLEYRDSRSVVFGDIDRDGDIDIGVLNLDSYDDYYYGWKIYASQLEFLTNDGAGRFVRGPRVELPYGSELGDAPLPVHMTQGDFDGDGDNDYVVGAINYYRREALEVTLIEMRSRGMEHVIHPAIVFDSDGRWGLVLASADLDLDGDLDVVVKQVATTNWILVNTGGLLFDVTELSLNPRPTTRVTLDDVDRDGRVDLVYGYVDGFAVSLNITPSTTPQLLRSAVKRGQPVSLVVRDAEPGETVQFLYTLQGAGNSVGVRQLGGITLDLTEPFHRLGSAVADANGVAELTVNIPPDAPLREVVLQAAIRRGPRGAESVKTPFRTTRIQP